MLREIRGPLITTQYVLIELGNWLRSVNQRAEFLRMLEHLKANALTTVIETDPLWWEAGIDVYRRHADKEWSLTDCISFAIMQHLGLTDALTADRHFEQAGFRALLLA